MNKNIEISKIIKSNRKTLSLVIDSSARLIVRAPVKTSERVILNFVNEKRNWIISTQTKILERKKRAEKSTIDNKGKILYLGKYFELSAVENYKYAFNFDGKGFFIDSKYVRIIPRVLTLWYKQQALKHFNKRLEYFANSTGLVFTSLKLSNAVKRWGSCSSQKSINLSWRLIMAPPEVIDYVIVHELAHTKELNHSAKFWRLVAGILPKYREQILWLKENGNLLEVKKIN